MKSHYTLFFFLCLAMSVWVACSNGNTDQNDNNGPDPEATGITADDLVGEWVSSSVRFEIKSMGGEEGDTVIEAMEENYLEILGIKANFSTLNADGTFDDAYQMPNDSIERGDGKWSVRNDSLVFMQENPSPRTHVYKVEVSGDSLLKVIGYVDFDGDGERDDLFTGTSYKRQ